MLSKMIQIMNLTPVVPPNDEYVSEDELDEACTDSDSESDSSS